MMREPESPGMALEEKRKEQEEEIRVSISFILTLNFLHYCAVRGPYFSSLFSAHIWVGKNRTYSFRYFA